MVISRVDPDFWFSDIFDLDSQMVDILIPVILEDEGPHWEDLPDGSQVVVSLVVLHSLSIESELHLEAVQGDLEFGFRGIPGHLDEPVVLTIDLDREDLGIPEEGRSPTESLLPRSDVGQYEFRWECQFDELVHVIHLPGT